MDKIAKYEKSILAFLNVYAENFTNDPSGIETQIIVDREHKHFQIVRTGWSHERFHHYVLFHISIKKGKVWIEQNNTEDLIGDGLAKHGIPKEDIVLGFQPENVRKFTGFGVA